jgi:coproporphyrinogen III oxidase
LIKQLTPIKIGKEKAKKLAENLRDKIKAKIVEINEARDAKQAEWKAEAAEHDKLTAIIQAGRTILQSVLSPSFLQTTAGAKKTALMQLSSHF